jgi:hypothetical protein
MKLALETDVVLYPRGLGDLGAGLARGQRVDASGWLNVGGPS